MSPLYTASEQRTILQCRAIVAESATAAGEDELDDLDSAWATLAEMGHRAERRAWRAKCERCRTMSRRARRWEEAARVWFGLLRDYRTALGMCRHDLHATRDMADFLRHERDYERSAMKAMRDERDTARAALGRCREVLRRIENGATICPYCGKVRERVPVTEGPFAGATMSGDIKHFEICALAAALKGTL